MFLCKKLFVIKMIYVQSSSMIQMFWFIDSSCLIVDVAMLVNASILGVVAWEEMQYILKLGQKRLILVIL